ncbi:MAG: hypothetical protein M3Z37_10355 [Candidatus Eremiobacteraeota bacterium]|nr:hypothetical protein [Candidatus Eremiobacteraeota bacterium]
MSLWLLRIAAYCSVVLLLVSAYAGSEHSALAAGAAATQTAPPDIPAASPTPQALSFSGQVIDLERGYIVFSSGDALKVASSMRIIDATTGVAPGYTLAPGFFALATVDPASGTVVELRTSHKPLPVGTPVASVPRQYVVAVSSPRPNPDLTTRAALYRSVLSKQVTVTVTVSIPANTPFNEDIYMATNTSGWNPQAIKMQRVDGLHFRIQMDLSGGTEIRYLFTRGSWNSVERDRAGLQRQARTLFVPGGDAQVIEATVYRWADLP